MHIKEYGRTKMRISDSVARKGLTGTLGQQGKVWHLAERATGTKALGD